LIDHPDTGTVSGEEHSPWPAAGLVLVAGAVVACGAWAAAASAAGRPSWELIAAWACLFILLLLGLAAGRSLSRSRAFPRWALGLVFVVSAVAQAPLVAAPPALSDDLWRYLHDGRVLLAGVNPYEHPPASPALDEIAGPERARVNHPQVRTAYPLLAEAGFAALVMLGGGSALLKAALSVCGLGLCAWVAVLLAPEERWRVIALAWHPLLLLEVAGSGHLDVVGVFLLTAALWALGRPAGRLAGAALLVAGAWVKLLPALVALPLARRLGVPLAGATLVLGLAAVLPALLTPVPEQEQQGLSAYAEHWDFNGPVYPWLRGAVEGVQLMEGLQALSGRFAPSLSRWAGPQYTTRALLGLGWLACLAWGLRRAGPGGEPIEAAFFACAGFVIFTPTLHPWYAVWILPFVALRPSPAWLWLSGAVGLSYASAVVAGQGPWTELSWPRWCEYAPFALLLAWECRPRVRDPSN
jgi:hypothetical protein